MKKYYFLLFISLSVNVLVNAQKKIFLRIYSIASVKTVNGFYGGHTDSLIIVVKKHHLDTISYINLRQIKTRRSTGHHILIGAVLGTITGAITGLITNKESPPPYPNCQLCGILDYSFSLTPAEAAEAGALLGGTSGAALGAIIGLASKKNTLNVNGDYKNWESIKTRLDEWPAYLPK